MHPPANLRPLPLDAAAADDARAELAALAHRIEVAMVHRRRLVAAAREDWSGMHRTRFDEGDAAIERATATVLASVEATRRKLAAQVDEVREVNRLRARALAEWEARQVAVTPAPMAVLATVPAPTFDRRILR